jgi:hypothetical protein
VGYKKIDDFLRKLIASLKMNDLKQLSAGGSQFPHIFLFVPPPQNIFHQKHIHRNPTLTFIAIIIDPLEPAVRIPKLCN